VTRRELAPLLIPLALAPWIAIALGNWLQAPLFRDVGMMQYGAWCMTHGVRLYDGIATPDGPVPYLVHALLQVFVGTGEHAYRGADVVFHTLGAFAVGAMLAPACSSRPVWGLTHAGIWLAFLLHADFGASVQREEYYVLLGMGAVVLAYRAGQMPMGRLRTAALVGAGAMAAAMMFGKHTGAVYVLLGVMACPAELRRRYAAGVGIGVASMLGLIAVLGSLRGFAFWYVRYPLEAYRFWHAVPAAQIAGDRNFNQYSVLAVGALLAGGAAIAVGLLPRRSLAFAIAPALHFAAALAQRKGWHYQFMPVIGAAHVLFTVGLAALWQGHGEPWSPSRTIAAALLLTLVGGRCLDQLLSASWMVRDMGELQSAAEPIVSTRQAATLLASVTRPGDRVFLFGFEAMVPFLAQRPPAVPYMVPWMLWFEGGLGDIGGVHPTDAQLLELRALEREVQADACARLRRSHPQAMVFIDGGDQGGDAIQTVGSFCPDVLAWIGPEYSLAGQFGGVRVFSRQP